MVEFVDRKILPLSGHKSQGMRTCHTVYCECGWTSCAHWERREAWGEWREHIVSHGAEREPWDKARARHDREQSRLREKYLNPAENSAGDRASTRDGKDTRDEPNPPPTNTMQSEKEE